MQPDWSQIIWFRVWLKWQLLIRGTPIPRMLERYADLAVTDYCAALHQHGLEPRNHDIFRESLPHQRLPDILREAVSWNRLKWSTGTESGMGYIDLSEYRFNDLQFIITSTIEAKRGHVHCAQCGANFSGREVLRKIWKEPVVKLTGAGGRTFTCPNHHQVFSTMDWIS